MRTRSNAGLTMIEVIIASVILISVVLISMSLLFNASTTYTNESSTLDLEDRGALAGDFFEDDLLAGRYTGPAVDLLGTAYAMGIYTSNTEIRYQIPAGDDGTGNNAYGYLSPLEAPDGGLQANLVAVVRFEAEDGFRESASAMNVNQVAGAASPFPNLPNLTVSVLDIDVNKDGDMNDSFARGKLVLYVFAPDGHTLVAANGGDNLLGSRPIADFLMLAVNPAGGSAAFNGDVDGDGTNDPLFQFVDNTGTEIANAAVPADGAGIIVTLWTGNFFNLDKDFQIRRNTATIEFRNAQ